MGATDSGGGGDSGWSDPDRNPWRDPDRGRGRDGWRDDDYYYGRNRNYTITSQTSYWSGGGSASFTIDASSNNLQSVAVGSTTLLRGNQYTVSSGRSGYGYQTGSDYGYTYVNLLDSYLQTLSNGTHAVYFNFTNGRAVTTITIARPTATPTPAPIVTIPTLPGIVTPITGTGNYIVSVRSTLNVRSTPNAYGAKLGSLANGARVTVGQISGGWGNINYGGSSGWVSMAYLLPTGTTPGTVSGTYTVTGYVNMRLGPGTSFGIAGQLPPGTIVQIQLFSGSYGLANINGQNVYLHRNYLR